MLLRIVALLILLSLLIPVSAEKSEVEWVVKSPDGTEYGGSGKVVDLKGVTKGVYSLTIYWRGVKVAERTMAINDGNVVLTIDLPFRDVSFEIRDLRGRLLSDAEVKVSPEVYSDVMVSGGVVSLISVPESAILSVYASWENKDLRSRASILITNTPEGLARRGFIRLPVGDLVLVVLDQKGNALAGAEVFLNGVSKITNAFGEAVFEMVPLHFDGRPITYDLRIELAGIEVTPRGYEKIVVSPSVASIVIPAQLYELRIRVIGDAGQGLRGAQVRIIREGVLIDVKTSDAGGLVVADRLPISEYSLDVLWNGLKEIITISPVDLDEGRVIEVKLPVYAEILGIPLSFTALIALIILQVAIIIAVAVIMVEYIRWRGKKVLPQLRHQLTN